MPKISIRFQQIKDAKRLFSIFNNPNFLYISIPVKSVEEEREWIKKNPARRRANESWNYAILYGDQVVGAIGIKINQDRRYIGEIGYFLDEAYWGKGITSRAVKLIEKEAFAKLGLTRLEILMRPANKASEKVAIKNKYRKEGLMRKVIQDKEGKMIDALLYAKVL